MATDRKVDSTFAGSCGKTTPRSSAGGTPSTAPAPVSGPIKTADTGYPPKPMVNNPSATSPPAADTGPGASDDQIGTEEK